MVVGVQMSGGKMDWNEIEVLKTGGKTFWRKKGKHGWSRNIVELINYLKELEVKK